MKSPYFLAECIKSEVVTNKGGHSTALIFFVNERGNYMTSYEFEKEAKNSLIKVLSEKYSIRGVDISDVNFVWFSYQLGGMKCTLYSPKIFNLYAEVTYNKDKNEMYLDIYKKDLNVLIKPTEESDGTN